MRLFLLLPVLWLGIFAGEPTSVFTQNSNDWVWYHPTVASKYMYDFKPGPDGAFWMASESKIVRFDGNNWSSFDFLDAGITIQPYNAISYFGFGPDGKIWCSTYNRVLELDPLANTWKLHDPSNGIGSPSNGKAIQVYADGRVLWLTGNGFYVYNGSAWTYGRFSFPGLNINSFSYHQLLIDDEQTSWFVTPSAICFDIPCFVPAGIIHYNGVDTIAYNSPSLGFPEIEHIGITQNNNGKPLLVINEKSPYTMPAEPSILAFDNGNWQTPVDVPFSLTAWYICTNSQGDTWLGGRTGDQLAAAVLRKADGSWQQIAIDSQKIKQITSIYADSAGNFWVAGRVYEYANGAFHYTSALGLLPASNFRAQGLVFADANSNGSPEPGEPGLPHHILEVFPGPSYVMTSDQGIYSARLPAEGAYTVQTKAPKYFTPTLPASGGQGFSVTTAVPLATALDFGFFPQADATDVSATITALNPARPGFEVCYRIDFKNEAPQTANGTITCTFDPSLIFQNASAQPVSNINNSLVFSFSNLEWMEDRSIEICFLVPTDAVLGTTLQHSGQIVPGNATDLYLPDNSFGLRQTVIGSYDPNVKEVEPAGLGAQGYIPSDVRFLEYTIHFQNTGTDTAFTVLVTDSISPLLDIARFQMLAASHQYRLDLYDNRVLRWTFPDIQLPDSTTNEQRSHGFVKFSMALNADLPPGTSIQNQADIYFDFNQPVRTNTVVNTLSDISAVEQSAPAADCDWDLQQTSNYVKISGKQAGEPVEVTVFDALGKLISTRQLVTGDSGFWLGDLRPGMYFVVLQGVNLCRKTKQIAVF